MLGVYANRSVNTLSANHLDNQFFDKLHLSQPLLVLDLIMKYVLAFGCLATLVCCFTITAVYLQAIDRIIQKLVENYSADSDYQVLCENIEVYNGYSSEFLEKLKAKDPAFRRIAIEHCRIGQPEFPNCLNIHAFQMNHNWNDTQAAIMFNLVNTTRQLWMEYDDICQHESHERYLNKFSPDFK